MFSLDVSGQQLLYVSGLLESWFLVFDSECLNLFASVPRAVLKDKGSLVLVFIPASHFVRLPWGTEAFAFKTTI